ncbi:hypothetical protein C8R47DRAFT_1214279 [Mycena vitilis]|nr:hypothetical protein C8R47DRAFT_1214279 [Mycena vitilis]
MLGPLSQVWAITGEGADVSPCWCDVHPSRTPVFAPAAKTAPRSTHPYPQTHVELPMSRSRHSDATAKSVTRSAVELVRFALASLAHLWASAAIQCRAAHIFAPAPAPAPAAADARCAHGRKTPPRGSPLPSGDSGYKAWEFNLYFFGIGPALLYGILPDKYYRNYCKAVRSIRILLQEEATPEEILEAHRLYSEFSDEFEQLYIQGRADRLHFARPVLHTISHMPGETVRKGPANIYSQWALERTIGILRAIRRCQVNALTAIIPDLEPELNKLPRGAVDVGGGYVLLRAQDSCSRPVRGCEEAAIREYLRDEFGDDIAEEWQPSVVRWARLRLPNGQIVRSWWKEEYMTQLRAARHVKVQTTDYDDPELAEVLFFLILNVEGEERYLAVASFFGPPEPHLFNISSKCFWSVNHLRESDIRVIDVTSILSCVTMAPDHQYQLYRQDGSEIDRWHLMEKPRLKLASWSGRTENMEED